MIAPRGNKPGKGVAVQAQLETTSPGDEYEREADSMADLVLRKIESGAAGAISSAPAIQARPSVSAYGGSAVSLPSQMESRMRSSLGGGQSLPGQVRSQMESAFGQSFSQVNIHTDSAAAEMSRSIGAKAFTYGNDIYFNAGQYRPETADGLHLLAHELTHTVQQGGKVARDMETEESGDGVTFGDVIDVLLKINNYLIKAKAIVFDLANQYSQLRPAVQAMEECIKHVPRLVKFYQEASGAVGAASKRVPVKLMAGVAWAYSVYSLLSRGVNAASDSVPACLYYFGRAVLVFVTPPPPLPSIPGDVGWLIKVFNLASFLGDTINIPLESAGYHEYKGKVIADTEKMYRGGGGFLQGTAMFMASIPLYGEFSNWVAHKILD